VVEAAPGVGFIGTGTMGGPMVRQLLAAGHRTLVWNRTPGKLEALARAGAEPVRSPAELARGRRLAILCVTDTAAVEAVVFGSRASRPAVPRTRS
jgi:3-hydroxyisobutyrate dehydrogenase